MSYQQFYIYELSFWLESGQYTLKCANSWVSNSAVMEEHSCQREIYSNCFGFHLNVFVDKKKCIYKNNPVYDVDENHS